MKNVRLHKILSLLLIAFLILQPATAVFAEADSETTTEVTATDDEAQAQAVDTFTLNVEIRFIHPTTNARHLGTADLWSANPDFVKDFQNSFTVTGADGTVHKPTKIMDGTTSMVFENLPVGEYQFNYSTLYRPFFTPYVYMLNGYSLGAFKATQKQVFSVKDSIHNLKLEIRPNVPLKAVAQTEAIKVPAYDPNLTDDENVARIQAALPEFWNVYDELFPNKVFRAKLTVFPFVIKNDLSKFVSGASLTLNANLYQDAKNFDPIDLVYSNQLPKLNVNVIVGGTNTVTFKDNYEGSPQDTIVNVNDDGTVNAPQDPTREGYTFLGWYQDAEGNGEKIDFATATFTEDTTVYAKWEKNPVSVTFDKNFEGASSAQVVQTDGNGIVKPSSAYRQYWTFLGWYDNPEGTGEAIDFATHVFAQDTTVYAKWQKDTCTLEFNFNFIHQLSNYRYLGTPDLWSANPDFVSSFQNSFSLIGQDGKEYKPTKVVDGVTSMVFENLPTGRYTFKYTAPYSNKMFKPYVYMYNKRSLGSYTSSQSYSISQKDTTNTLSLELSALVPLNPKEQSEPIKVPAIDPNLTNLENVARIQAALPKTWDVYDALFPEKTFRARVSIDQNPIYQNLANFVDGAKLTLRANFREDSTNLDTFDKIYTFAIANHDLQIEVVGLHKVIFDQNFEGAPEAISKETDLDKKVTAPQEPTREGYIFLGWYQDSEGSGEKIDFASTIFAEDTTVYAKWEEDVPKVKVKLNVIFKGLWARKGPMAKSLDLLLSHPDFLKEFQAAFTLVDVEDANKVYHPEISVDKNMILTWNGVPQGTYTLEFANPYTSMFRTDKVQLNGGKKLTYRTHKEFNIGYNGEEDNFTFYLKKAYLWDRIKWNKTNMKY